MLESLDQINGRQGLAVNKIVTLPPENPDTIQHLKLIYEPQIESSACLDDVVFNTACFIKEVSNINQAVSDICDFGFLIKENSNTLLKVNIRDSADTIIEACNKGTLRNHWKIITSFSF
jgi:hypothetical protein